MTPWCAHSLLWRGRPRGTDRGESGVRSGGPRVDVDERCVARCDGAGTTTRVRRVADLCPQGFHLDADLSVDEGLRLQADQSGVRDQAWIEEVRGWLSRRESDVRSWPTSPRSASVSGVGDDARAPEEHIRRSGVVVGAPPLGRGVRARAVALAGGHALRSPCAHPGSVPSPWSRVCTRSSGARARRRLVTVTLAPSSSRIAGCRDGPVRRCARLNSFHDVPRRHGLTAPRWRGGRRPRA